MKCSFRTVFLPVPGRSEYHVAESEGDEVLDHLLAEVVVDTVELLLAAQRELDSLARKTIFPSLGPRELDFPQIT